VKKLFAIVMSTVLLLALVPGVTLADKPGSTAEGYNGNGAPSGEHVTLNIVGVQNVKSNPMTYPEEDPSGRSTIFVGLGDDETTVTTRIYLKDGGDIDTLNNWKDAFGVIDANGTDGVARFQIANPDYDAYVVGDTPTDAVCDYLIVARPLGKPGGWATITTCAELVDATGGALKDLIGQPALKALMQIINETDGSAYCSVQPVPAEFTFRHEGKEKFENVTAYLTSIVFLIWVDQDGDGLGNVIAGDDPDPGDYYWYIRVPIFDPLIKNEYWKIDNNGLKLFQIRFYPIETDVTYADPELPPRPPGP
jgi:hypothetical protein